jgi:uncharacterized coiled-coil protein SlyX
MTRQEDNRLEALETKLSYQERSLAELSSELFAQARRVERLEQVLGELAGKVKEVADSVEQPAPGDVRPPHW